MSKLMSRRSRSARRSPLLSCAANQWARAAMMMALASCWLSGKPRSRPSFLSISSSLERSARSSQVFTPFSPSATSMAGVSPRGSASSSVDAQFAALGSQLLVLLLQIVCGRGRAVRWPRPRRSLRSTASSSTGTNATSSMLVKPSVTSRWAITSSTSSASMNICERVRNSSARRSDSCGLGQDVDVPAGQLRGEAHVLAAAADGQGQLLVGHHHFDAAHFLVQHHLGDFGRRQRVHHEGRGIAATRE